MLKMIAAFKKKATPAKVTAELKQYLRDPVSTITVRIELLKNKMYIRVTILMPLVTGVNVKRRLKLQADIVVE